MEGVIEVKAPFGKKARHALSAPFAVILPKKGDGKSHAHLQNSVDGIEKNGIHGGVDGHVEEHPPHLYAEFPPIGAEGQDGEGGNRAPIGGKGKEADEEGEAHFQGHPDPFRMGDAKQKKPKGQGPHYAGLIEKFPRGKGEKGLPSPKIGGKEHIGKMGDEGEGEKSGQIPSSASGVPIPLGDEIAHHGAGDAPQKMQDEGKRLPRIPGPKDPGHVIKGHGKNGNELKAMGSEVPPFLFRLQVPLPPSVFFPLLFRFFSCGHFRPASPPFYHKACFFASPFNFREK